ncbi:thiamine phosphate synthase [Dysosmobacter sp.]|uniref:thiamine phosphate synthase n=1 Tax=Dysosmobacter sp. TaxID=2591382 RepID=UPI002A98EF17|nr:thiamine phosphate synthase [Dysosmobacter sp.]MCI6054930.1 thiamine phosphate synthase [Dysosmobacter sp.]MDY5510858.1 thiamine phosphate synthase [Dysosmobacter sp.]
MKLNGSRLRLYAVTDRAWAADEDALMDQIAAAIDGGAGIVQLREKHLDHDAFLKEAKRFVALCREKGALSVINDDVDIALAADADGVHVGQEDLAAGRAREVLGPDKIVGVSAHNVDEALAAQAAGADYLGVGAAFSTGTKTDAKPITRETIHAVTAAVDIPAVAIGGITRENLPQLSGCGLAGVAVVSALFAQSDVKAAAAELLALSEEMARN